MKDCIKKFIDLTAKIQALYSAGALFTWDMMTDAPKGGTASRAKYMGILKSEEFSLRISDTMKEYLEILETNKNLLDEKTTAMVKICRREYDANKKIPVEEMRAFSELLPVSEIVWEKAKENNDFASFAPTLAKIVDYQIRFAKYRGYEDHPLDAHLEDYEPGMTVKKLDEFFSFLKESIVPLLRKITTQRKKTIRTDFLERYVPIEKQKKISYLLIKKLPYDLNRGMLKESAHPFTNELGQNDVRITTKYYENYFLSSFYSVMHECGHAIYEQNKMPDIADTILDTGTSMGLHESQSRFYENVIGRSEAFWENIYDELTEILGFDDVSAREFYEASNRVQPSLIRVEADELTYSLHVMVRYEIEKSLFSGEISVYDLPEIWNSKMKEYLGIVPQTDSQGVLQDVHWSGGSFGYFPSYALGNAYAAQILYSIKKDLSVSYCIRKNNIASIQKWLAEKIHQYGSIKIPSQLILDVTGEPLNPKYYIEYLQKKYTALYEL